MSKHTDGPWRMEKFSEDALYTTIGGPVASVGGQALGESVEFVVGTSGDWGPHGDAETEANARLIAACPDLLKACRMIEKARLSGVAGDKAYAADLYDAFNAAYDAVKLAVKDTQ